MNANDVYTIAKALSNEERVKLYHILKSELKVSNDSTNKQIKKKKLPHFTMEDGLRYLIDNHIKNKQTNHINN